MNRTKKQPVPAPAAGLAIVIAFSVSSFCWGQLWGIQPATNRIVQVNPVTGATFGGFVPPGGALVAPQQFGGLTMAEHGAVMLYQNPLANPTDLFRLNPNTGALLSTHFMPAAGNPDFRAGLSFQSGAGAGGADAVYAINDGAPVQRQDGYGNPALVDHIPSGAHFAGALGGDDNGRLFVARQNQIQEFDPAVANSVIASLPYPPAAGTVGGLAFDGTWLYLSTVRPQGSPDAGRLMTIHPDTGEVVNDVLVQGGQLVGLAARPVPEPSAALLTVVGGILVPFHMGRRRRRA